MGSRSASRVPVFLTQQVFYGWIFFALCAGTSPGQASQNPEEPPNSPEQLLKEAESLYGAGKLEQAIADYRLLLQKYPDVAPVRSDLGAALAGTGRYDEAIVEYKRALELQPLPEVRLNLALAYYKSGNLTAAVEQLKKVLQEKPNELRPALLLADCYLRLGDNKKVIEVLTPVQAANPDDMGIVYMLGTALVRDNQADKGQVLIDRILRNGDSAEARLLLGTTKLMVDDFAGARDDFEKAVSLNPDLPEVQAYYGLALLSTGDQAGAEDAFRRALEKDPNNFDSNVRMGVILRGNEQLADAAKYFRHALEIRPGDIGVRYQIAALELGQGQVEEARNHLEAIVKEAPNFTEAHVSLATAYYREKKKVEGDRERAIVEKLNAERQAKEKGAQVQR